MVCAETANRHRSALGELRLPTDMHSTASHSGCAIHGQQFSSFLKQSRVLHLHHELTCRHMEMLEAVCASDWGGGEPFYAAGDTGNMG